jgi:hypothetical protein
VIVVIVATAAMDEMVATVDVMIVAVTAVEIVAVTAASVLIAAGATIAVVVSDAMSAPTVVDVSNVDLLVDVAQARPPSCMSDSAVKLASVPKTWSERSRTKAASLVATSATSKFLISSRSLKFRVTRWITS